MSKIKRDNFELKDYEGMLKIYANVIEQTSASIIITDEVGKIKYVNKRFTDITGYSIEEVIENTPNIFKSGHTTDEEYKKLWQTISAGLIWRGIFYNRKKNGEMYWESASITPVTNDEKKITHYIAIKVDITEKKKLEDDLKFANEIISNMEEGVYLIRAKDAIIVYTNPKFDRMFGYEKGELIGKHVSVVNAPSKKSPEETAKEIIDSLAKNNTWRGEVNNIKKDGGMFCCHASVSKFSHSEYGEVWISVHKDISDRKKAEILLKKIQTEQQILLDNIPAWVFYKDTENRFIRVNKAFADVMKMDKKELEGKSLLEFFTKEEADAYWRDDKEVIALGKSKINIIEQMQSPEGLLWVRTDKIPYKDEHGNIIGVVGFTMDITERKNAEIKINAINEELKELVATKDKFFSIIAHDLKSPFQGLMGYSQILNEEFDTLTEEEKKEFIKSIQDLSKSTFQLLDNLLLWSRLQSGKISYNLDLFNFYREMLPTIYIMEQTAKNKEIEVEYLVDKRIFVYGDINMLSTVLRNIISNAIKFTNKRGKIIVNSKTDGKFAEIMVTDNGVGMNEKTRENLFKIGFTSSRKGTFEEEGTGLGLILCKEMIKMNGGEISVESEIGKGSKFSFTIPIMI